jgi:hypothetical protein
MLTTNDLIRKIATVDISLTLFNEKNELATSSDLTTLVHSKTKARMRFKLAEKMKNILPFTHAMIHSGNDIYGVVAIRPLMDHEGNEVEIVYDY